jgi:glycosyltransferase
MLRALELHAVSSAYVPGPLVDFLVGGASSGMKSVLLANIGCLKSRRKHLGAPLIDFAFFLKPGIKMLTQLK